MRACLCSKQQFIDARVTNWYSKAVQLNAIVAILYAERVSVLDLLRFAFSYDSTD